MQRLKDKITLVNHASVLIESNGTSILSDPWFFGPAFNGGWSLLFENKEEEIKNILSRTKYIWISHEHPDHFSVPFFFKYKELLLEKKIKILFQKTTDGRVKDFLKKVGLEVIELPNYEKVRLTDDIHVKCIKSGFYDSALYVETPSSKILNLNDCPLREKNDFKDFQKHVDSVDLLLTQFSYAAWKGGKDNIEWRKEAAKEKIDIIIDQAVAFNAKLVMPFASYIKFCSKYNNYLNDSHNTTVSVKESLDSHNIECAFPKPMVTHEIDNLKNNYDGISFWEDLFQKDNLSLDLELDSVDYDSLHDLGKDYQKRVFKNNNKFIIWTLKLFNIFGAFKPVNIYLYDIKKTVRFSFFKDLDLVAGSQHEIEMHSNSLAFIFKNSFGFDTLTVNGCFEEKEKGAFVKLTKNFAVENLNNLGVPIGFKALLSPQLFGFFFTMIRRVNTKLN